MSSSVVRVLYRSLVESVRRLERETDAGRTLYHALRSGAVDTYNGVKDDWQRERGYERQLEIAKRATHWSAYPSISAALVRTHFHRIQDHEDPDAHRKRIDTAFSTLREIDDHNALISNFTAQGAFKPKKRSAAIRFRVGDIVEVDEVGVGVIVSWAESRAHEFGQLRVSYDILPDTSYHGDRTRLHRVAQDEIHAVAHANPVQHPSVLVYFDGFQNGRHIPSPSLARLYPEDVLSCDTLEKAGVPHTPSILQLQFADEEKLVEYLQCDDSTVIQLVLAALEGKWISECGGGAHQQVRQALKRMEQGDFGQARDLLLQTVADFPDYAFAWAKLGKIELETGNPAQALAHYQQALRLKPHLVNAIAGVGASAAHLRRWSVAHRAAIDLQHVQPSNEAARLLLHAAVLASLTG